MKTSYEEVRTWRTFLAVKLASQKDLEYSKYWWVTLYTNFGNDGEASKEKGFQVSVALKKGYKCFGTVGIPRRSRKELFPVGNMNFGI